MSDFARRLIAWHHAHGRHDLPWQGGHDPYRIWLSEIMLQQTQVDTVIPYYRRFLARFPDLASLADAEVEEVMALWSGLGYYARARNLHRAARELTTVHGGAFPRSAARIAELPGVGRSTAAAIAAFAFGERAAILDGNVKRVLCRAFGVEGFPGSKAVENELWALAESLLPPTAIATYIQAQMDLGATLCTRARPACPRCPLAADCVARRDGRTAELPAARPRKAVPQRRQRVAVIVRDGAVLLERRPPAGIWGGLAALPEVPAEAADIAGWAHDALGIACSGVAPLAPLRHAFTHFVLELEPLRLEAGGTARSAQEGNRFWQPLADLEGAALPTPVRRILQALAPSPAAPAAPPRPGARSKGMA
jgi:A/G-specific adenine glycosylase